MLRSERRGVEDPTPCATSDRLRLWQAAVDEVYVSEAVVDYLLALVRRSREMGEFPLGLSPRAGLALLRAARAWAFLHGRDSVWPDDVREVFAPVAGHRLRQAGDDGNAALETLLESVAVP